MAGRTLQTPDGRQWQVEVSKGILPPWRAVETHSEAEAGESASGTLQRGLLVLLFGALIFPFVIWLIELPFRLLLSPFVRTQTVRAKTAQPTKETVTWKTRATDDVTLAQELAAHAPPMPAPTTPPAA